jgi:hypothetical protein
MLIFFSLKIFLVCSALLALAAADGDHAHAHAHAGPILAGPGPIVHGPILAGPGTFIQGPGPIFHGPGLAGPPPAIFAAAPAPVFVPARAPVVVSAPAPIYRPVPVPSYAPAPEPIYEGPAVYNFGYAVQDAAAGLNFGHNEDRNGYNTQGSYYVNLPDGRLQTVNYHADEAGYVADVSYSGNAVVPSYAPVPVPAFAPK